MFRITQDQSSGSFVQCLAKNYKNDSIVSVDMDKVGVMAAYSDPLCVCVVQCVVFRQSHYFLNHILSKNTRALLIASWRQRNRWSVQMFLPEAKNMFTECADHDFTHSMSHTSRVWHRPVLIRKRLSAGRSIDLALPFLLIQPVKLVL